MGDQLSAILEHEFYVGKQFILEHRFEGRLETVLRSSMKVYTVQHHDHTASRHFLHPINVTFLSVIQKSKLR